jgi:AraC family transcriptional regulator
MTDDTSRIGLESLRQRTQLEYQARLNLVIGYIQQHLQEPIALEELARVACFSPFHIHRIFTAFIGESPGEYIRRLRMGQACLELVSTQRPITEISLEVGYETPAAFTRAFRQFYRETPSQVRKTGKFRPAAPLATGQSRQSIQSNSVQKGSYIMKTEIRTLPDQQVIFVTSRGMVDNTFNQAAKRSFDLLCAWIDQRGLWSKTGACLGICPDDPAIDPQEARYMGGFIIKQGEMVEAEGEVESTILPGGRWAVIMYQGPFEGLTQAWSDAYREWLPASGERLRDTPPYEVYLTDNRTPPEQRVTEIYIALE